MCESGAMLEGIIITPSPADRQRLKEIALNAVEGFFAKLTQRRLKNGVFHSVVDGQAAINRFIREYNAASPKPFTLSVNPDYIIAARNRGFQTLESIH